MTHETTPRVAAAAAAAFAVLLLNSAARYQNQHVPFIAFIWLFVVMLMTAAPYGVIARFAKAHHVRTRAFARGFSIALPLLAITLIVSVIVGFVAIMSGWNEHPNAFWRVVRIIGAAPMWIAVSFRGLLESVKGFRSPYLAALILANLGLFLTTGLGTEGVTGQNPTHTSVWKRYRALGVCLGIALPFACIFAMRFYHQLAFGD